MLLVVQSVTGNEKNRVIADDFISEYCAFPYTSNAEAGNRNVLFTWETLANGNIVISIAPGEGTDVATFRGDNGLAPGGFKVNGNANTANAYFQLSLNAEKNQITLAPQQSIPERAEITHNALMEWATTGDGNEYTWTAPFTTPYTYGSNCTGIYVQKLATPAGVSINASNVLTFTEVQNANNYIVAVKFGTATLKILNVAGSGETISVPFSGNFDVTVTASDNTAAYANSEPSAPYSWTSTATDGATGNSIFCEYPVTDGVSISIETATETGENIETGDLIFTISGDAAGFRGTGVRLANLIVGGVAGTSVLTKVGGDLDNPNVFRPISGLGVAKGTLISYKGELELTSATNNNIWGERTFNNYVYGSTCDIPQLNAPAGLTLGAGNTLTFTPDANAASTTVYVYSGETKLLESANFASGDAINFPINGTFTVFARSITGSTDYLNSELSTGVELVVALPDGVVSDSEYCKWAFDPSGEGAYADDSDLAYLSWATDTKGDILINIEGTAANAETTAFRAPGLFIADITVGGVPAVNLLTIQFSESQLTLSPAAGISIPKGTIIAVTNGMVTYRVLPLGTPETELDNLWPRATFGYTYGATCQTVAMKEVAEENDAVIATHYYNLQGIEIVGTRFVAPAQGDLIIKKTIHQSGAISVSKIIRK
jgi:hypothetical protein